MSKKALSIIVGILAIAIGVGYTLAASGMIAPFTIFVPGWWTVFLIVPGLVMLFSRNSNKFFALFLIALGVVLFLQKNDYLGDVKKFIIPGLIILFGVSRILNALVGGRKKNFTFLPEIPEDGSIPAFETSFGELNPDYSGKAFEGCAIDIAFGSGKLDLRNAIIDKDVTITVNAAFSGVNIKLPDGCNVDLQTSTSFGGVTNKYVSSEMPDAPIVRIYAAVSFGGVDIN